MESVQRLWLSAAARSAVGCWGSLGSLLGLLAGVQLGGDPASDGELAIAPGLQKARDVAAIASRGMNALLELTPLGSRTLDFSVERPCPFMFAHPDEGDSGAEERCEHRCPSDPTVLPEEYAGNQASSTEGNACNHLALGRQTQQLILERRSGHGRGLPNVSCR